MKILYKNIGIIKMTLIISLLSGILSACATQLPAFDPSLPDSETAILVIPKYIYITTMDWDDSTFASQEMTFWTEPYENTAGPPLFEVPIAAYGG